MQQEPRQAATRERVEELKPTKVLYSHHRTISRNNRTISKGVIGSTIHVTNIACGL